ncbi:MAG: DUF4287 domain-containing protein [Blastomonas sp.]
MADNDAFAAVDAALQKKTGKSLAEWKAIAKGAGLDKHMALVGWLKAEHGLGHGHANTIAHAARESASVSISDDDLVTAMFAGPRAHHRETHDRILAAVRAFGSDVEAVPKKGYVSLRRSRQFALAQPSTKDRFDVGLNLKGMEVNGRLENSGSWNAMVTHRVRLASCDAVDDELISWLRAAYDRA